VETTPGGLVGRRPFRDRLGLFPGRAVSRIRRARGSFDALRQGLDTTEYDRLVWAPDAFGSICFLVSGYLAYVAVCGRLFCRPRRSREWWIAAINLLGCVAFGISAVASYVIPATGSVLDLARANATTAFGALCFLIGAVLLLPEED